jgi:hypothetical protein
LPGYPARWCVYVDPFQDPGERGLSGDQKMNDYSKDIWTECDSRRIVKFKAALEEIARQYLIKEMDDHDIDPEHADFECGYESAIQIARKALGTEEIKK